MRSANGTLFSKETSIHAYVRNWTLRHCRGSSVCKTNQLRTCRTTGVRHMAGTRRL